MKKLTALLLVIFFLLALAACGGDGESSVTPEETSAETSEPFKESETAAKIRGFFGEQPDRALKAKNLFEELEYTYNGTPLTKYKDPDMNKLIDGVIFETVDENGWVGFNGMARVNFDFGLEKHNLASVRIACYQRTSYGINLPKKVFLEVSDDGENFYELCHQLAPSDFRDSGRYFFDLALPGVVSARYVRITLSGNGTLLIGEIAGYEFCEDGNIDVAAGEIAADHTNYDYYNYHLEKDITVPVSESDEDYKKRQNLALLDGTYVTALSFDGIAPAYYSSNTDANGLQKLIDGKKGTNPHYSDTANASFLRAVGRHVVVDLGNVMAVDSVGAEMLSYPSAGIRIPEYVTVSLSVDGENFIPVDEGYTGQYMADGNFYYDFSRKLENKMKARYVRFSFINHYSYETTVECYFSELEAWGTKDTSGAVDAYTPEGCVLGSFNSPETLGIDAILWSCSGYVKDGYGFTYDNSLGYFAYLDENGKIKDRIFDSVVLGGLAKLRTPSDAKQGVLDWITEYTTPETNFDSLNKIAGDINEALGDDEKIKIWINLICPNSGFNCSDVDGDGKNEVFTDADDAYKFLKWQIDAFKKAFDEGNYENLEFMGYYWNNEYISKSDFDFQCALIKKMNDYIHKNNMYCVWAPYNGAYGIWAWRQVGFDLVTYQPNHSFSKYGPMRLYASAETARILGMGIELEVDDVMSEDAINVYREYLEAGVESGYMKAVNSLYQGAIPGAFMKAKDGDALARTVYDDTYKFIKGELDETYNTPEAKDLSMFKDVSLTVQNGKKADAEIGSVDGYKVRFIQSPSFGKFRLDRNGTFHFEAMKNFKGETAAVIEISDGAGNKKEITVTVEITE